MDRITPREWANEIMPRNPLGRALFGLVPPPAAVAMVAVGAAGVVTGESWPLWLSVGIGVFTLVHMGLDSTYRPICETVDHWVGDAEPPENLTDACPLCRPITLRQAWRAHRADRKGGGR
ncbi:hypothetical protein [Actinomadura coerulea]|uniref:hypothetical protein n=1 Tax=Actinomadura coerulea TaxID=46159 RepID=UPI00341FE088